MKTTRAAPPFVFEHSADGYARFSNGRVTLVRFRPGWRWEFYLVRQSGPERGLEMFLRYLRPDQGARLDAVVAFEETRRRAAELFQPETTGGAR